MVNSSFEMHTQETLPGQYSSFMRQMTKRGFLGSDGYQFKSHTGHDDQNCLIETVLISITGIYG